MKTKSILLLICIALLTSCAGKFGVMKRRYNKGFYVSVTKDHKTPSKHENHQKARMANDAVTKTENVPAASYNVSTTRKSEVTSTEAIASAKTPSFKTRTTAPSPVYASAGNKKVSVFKARSIVREIKKQEKQGSGASSVEPIVLIILCLLLPPLAVYLFHNAINADFWLSLILTLLFWVPGVVYAFLVCFAGVSIA